MSHLYLGTIMFYILIAFAQQKKVNNPLDSETANQTFNFA